MKEELKTAIKEHRTVQELKALLGVLDTNPFNARDIDFIYRAIQRHGDEPDVRMAYLSNHTVDPLPRYVTVQCARQQLILSDYVGLFNQYYQELLNPESGLAACKPTIIFFELCMRELSPQIYGEFLRLTDSERHAEMERILSHVQEWVDRAKASTDAVILVSNFPRPLFLQAGIADAQLDYGEGEFYHELNLELLRAFRGDARVYLFDLDHVLSRCGKEKASDPKMYFLAKMEWSEHCLPYIADEISRYIRAIQGQSKKCLVVDLDNTLWGGVVGEDGASGVKIGIGDPEGEAFLAFQRVIRSFKERGIILAICSKNNLADAMEVFETRSEMALRADDFAVLQINWEHKHQNLQHIASALNIGEDSLVFVDDSPVECELIRNIMPHVTTIQLPKDPASFSGIIHHLSDFEKLILTQEDRSKTAQYRENAQRHTYQQRVGDLRTFLEGLGTTLVVDRVTKDNMARVHQLFTKTNQFNVTTKRYGLPDIQRFMNNQDWKLNVVHVSDNFGSLGIVGLSLVAIHQASVVIDSFLLSCRALGRGVETVMMNEIKTEYLIDGRYKLIDAYFEPTKKNKPADGFYEQQGFSLVDKDGDGRQRYQLTKDNASLVDCPGIVVQMSAVS